MTENDQTVEVSEEEGDEEVTPTEETDTTDWKERAQELEQKAIRQREKTKAMKAELEALKSKSKEGKSGYENTLVKKAFLNSLGVPKEDHEFLLEEAERTGKELDGLMDFEYIQEGLRKRKDSRDTKAAIPTGTKRSGVAPKDSADYWFAKIERGEATLGQIPGVQLQRQVRKMREDKSGGTGMIYGSIKH